MVAAGRPVPSLLSLIPRQPVSTTSVPIFQQLTRDPNAAVVPPGTVKPETPTTLTPKTLPVQVIAHVTDGVDRFMLTDSATLERFLREELLWGLDRALEDEVVNGVGGAAHLEGILNTSGIQTQAFDTDTATSVRLAIAALEQQGLPATGVALDPTDWAALELTLFRQHRRHPRRRRADAVGERHPQAVGHPRDRLPPCPWAPASWPTHGLVAVHAQRGDHRLDRHARRRLCARTS